MFHALSLNSIQHGMQLERKWGKDATLALDMLVLNLDFASVIMIVVLDCDVMFRFLDAARSTSWSELLDRLRQFEGITCTTF